MVAGGAPGEVTVAAAAGAVHAGGSSVGKTRGVRVTPDGTACRDCHGRHVGAATGWAAATTCGELGPEPVATAYGVVSARPNATALSDAPATGSVHGRRRGRSVGVIAEKD
jgi:hypothetical protein